jgi:hypothetical protein
VEELEGCGNAAAMDWLVEVLATGEATGRADLLEADAYALNLRFEGDDGPTVVTGDSARPPRFSVRSSTAMES